jgi:hypothetical protein|tara:strand:+ start:1062 stop:1469 length:408 start_codon:yes stop_codon:yes gene_type:complete
MIKNCSSSGFFYQINSGLTLDETESICPAGCRVLLSSFSFTSRSDGAGHYFSGDSFTTLPRVEFMDASNNVVFGSLASNAAGLIGINGGMNGVVPTVGIPGRGVLFLNGLNVRVQAPATAPVGETTFALNIVYEI